MRKIVDVNYLRDSRLKKYFEEDKSNFIIFTDFACMECYKGRSLTNIKNSLEIVSDYPEQVMVLKNTGAVIKEDLSMSEKNEIFIDRDQTVGFRNFCIGVKVASEGDFFAKQLLKKSELASLDIENKKIFARLFPKGIEQINKGLDQKFVKVLRSGKPWAPAEYEYIWRNVIEICKPMFTKNNELPNKYTFARHYIFRYSLACFLLGLKWLSEGGWHSYSEEDMRNDLVDMSYVAYATCFDGVLSKDKKINELYNKSISFIGQLRNV